MKDLTKYYIDLGKLSQEEVKEVEKRTTKKCYYIKRAPFLHLFGKHWNQCMSESHSIKHKQELTYPEFIKLFEGGEGDNNGWIKIESEADLPKETCTLHVYPNYLERDMFFFHDDELSRDELMENHTHYQPIIKPEPPKF